MEATGVFSAELGPLSVGEAAPWFKAAIPGKDRFVFDSVAGRWVLLGFLPPPGEARNAAVAAAWNGRMAFDDTRAAAFLVIRDLDSIGRVQNQLPGLRWFLDGDGEVSRLYGASDAEAFWLLLDPALRVMGRWPMAEAEAAVAAVSALPDPGGHAGTELVAPVLIAPRVFEPAMCRRLIDYYEARGGERSGVMREIDGRTVPVLDDFKSRRDVRVTEEDFRAELRARLTRRLLPEIAKVFQFRATRLERYLIARYDAEEGGYFKPHRDNTTRGTAHRKFAVSINLNAEEFEGGDLRFPEFGQATYRPPTGGAVVFSCSLQHEATPVTRGQRYVFVPFLFDDAGEAVRQANREFLDTEAVEAG